MILWLIFRSTEYNNMLKNIIAPVQAWLMSQERCVGCGKSLKNGKREKSGDNEETVTCKNCGRVFIFNRQKQSYRRAPIETLG